MPLKNISYVNILSLFESAEWHNLSENRTTFALQFRGNNN